MNDLKVTMKEALNKARSGECKYKIFDDFKGRLDKYELAKQLSYVADIKLKNKYSILNNILIILLSIVGLLNVFNLVYNFYALNIYIILLLSIKIVLIATFIYLTVNFWGAIYKIISLLTVIEIINSKPLNIISSTNAFGIFIFIMILFIPLISFYINLKMFPYLGIYKIQKDNNGVSIFTSEIRQH